MGVVVLPYGNVLVGADLLQVVLVDDLMVIAFNGFGEIIFHVHVDIALAVNKDLFLAFLVVQIDFVVAIAPWAGLAFEQGAGFVLG